MDPLRGWLIHWTILWIPVRNLQRRLKRSIEPKNLSDFGFFFLLIPLSLVLYYYVFQHTLHIYFNIKNIFPFISTMIFLWIRMSHLNCQLLELILFYHIFNILILFQHLVKYWESKTIIGRCREKDWSHRWKHVPLVRINSRGTYPIRWYWGDWWNIQ